MRKLLRRSLVIGLSGAFACLSACSKLDVPKPAPAPVDAAVAFATIAGARQWYTYGRQSTYQQKNSAAQRSFQEVVPRSVAINWHAAVADHEYVVAPLVDDSNPFASANKFGYRYLVTRQLDDTSYDGRLVEFVVDGHTLTSQEAASIAIEGAVPRRQGCWPYNQLYGLVFDLFVRIQVRVGLGLSRW